MTLEPKIGFIFPGQGAQHIGMGIGLDTYGSFVQERFDQAGEALDFSVQELCFKGPLETLNQDVNAQLCIYTVSTIVSDILKNEGLMPDMCLGYSSGFYAAAYAAGCFDFLKGLSLVQNAGTALLRAGQNYNAGMAVIFGLPHQQVKDICDKIGHVDIAIINSPRQIIISGLKARIKSVMKHALRSGALDSDWISAATAYHSHLMTEAEKYFLTEINREGFDNPKIPLYSYATLNLIKDKTDLINQMARQLSRTVLWVDLIRQLRDNRPQTMVEVGPGKLLSRSIRWIDRHITIKDTSSASAIKETLDTLL